MFLLPGIGTARDLKQAHALGIRPVHGTARCTAADVCTQHIAPARAPGKDAAGFLTMPHLATPTELAASARLMEPYGANCVHATALGGRLTTDGVRERLRAYRDVPDATTETGAHTHHNHDLGVAGCVLAEADTAAGQRPGSHDRRHRSRPHTGKPAAPAGVLSHPATAHPEQSVPRGARA
ncbi:hypothetical protein ACIBK8_33350 [Streptomyces sp. NPDC050161]|uniref:hypothetical protein n=1 Tax=Streptomyces sp. NPDC050161 TaxID=3365604 RepID=UPI0037944D10